MKTAIGRSARYACILILSTTSCARASSLLNDALTQLSGWTVLSGSFVSVQAGQIQPASSSTYRMLISNGATTDPNAPPLSAVNGFVGANVDIGGYPNLDAGGAVEGSAVQRSFTATPGDTLTISYDFFSADEAVLSELSQQEINDIGSRPIYPDDYAFVAITHAGVTQVLRIADMLTPTYVDASLLNDGRFPYQTGFRTFQLALPFSLGGTDDSYTLSIGVMDGGAAYLSDPNDSTLAHSGESALLLDSIDVSSPASVPDPTAIQGGLALIAGIVAISRTRRRARNRPVTHISPISIRHSTSHLDIPIEHTL